MSVRKSDLYNIIPMSIDDLSNVHNLEIESYDFPWTKEILRDCILYKYDAFTIYFNNILVGYIIAKIAFPETHILNLTIRKNFRKKRLGTSLIKLIINDSIIRGTEDIILEVRVNNHDAIALYQKLDFKKVGVRKDYYESEEGREDAYVLKLKL
tara:strand:+ start:6416 stop:6877 length:462 start_codon:yes stop_codon:yes gene_type:complete